MSHSRDFFFIRFYFEVASILLNQFFKKVSCTFSFLSGHGFKMGPALGEQLARQVLDGTAAAPLFSYARFAEERAKLTGARRQHS